MKSSRREYLPQIHARLIGEASILLGAGRAKKTDPIDHGVGIVVHHKVGDLVEEDSLLFTVSVRLFDVNGLRGGPDKGCLVHVHFTDGTSIVGSDVDADLYRSVPAAFEKVLRSRRMNRARRHALRRQVPRAQLNPA